MATGRDIDSATKTDTNSLRYSQSGFRPDVAHSVFIYTPAGGEPAIKTYASEPVNENCFSLSFRPPLQRRPRNNDASLIAAGTTEPLSETADSRRYSRRLGRLHSCTPTACQSVLSSLVHIHPFLRIFFRSCTFQSTMYTFFRQCPMWERG